MHLVGHTKQIHFGVPGYLDLVKNFERVGFRALGHLVDSEGVRLNYQLIKPGDIVYLMPEHHFPQCVTLSSERCTTLESYSREHNIVTIEDDYDSEFYYNHRPVPL
ncbi:transcriptional regulator, GntR family with aminotransferase activity [Candidatus Burkholderia pumila]|uniref:Transcriptional regulator, GntR family with aminotransferase activity n=1 Tax=Candidatus Burkholderia pumila TaxID=1090375 RepID=A0ABR5HKD6_9BURK|nr:transcriptional regulator, GntR family with aminotransferase activity [Candidatus Burkholderia pumila]